MAPGDDAAYRSVVNEAYRAAQRRIADAASDAQAVRRAREQAEQVLTGFARALGWELSVRWDDPPTHPIDHGAEATSRRTNQPQKGADTMSDTNQEPPEPPTEEDALKRSRLAARVGYLLARHWLGRRGGAAMPTPTPTPTPTVAQPKQPGFRESPRYNGPDDPTSDPANAR